MVRVVHIIRKRLGERVEVGHEAVVHLQEIFGPQLFDPGHFVHQLQKEAMEPSVLATACLDELQQAPEAALGYHAAKGRLFSAAIEQEEVGEIGRAHV